MRARSLRRRLYAHSPQRRWRGASNGAPPGEARLAVWIHPTDAAATDIGRLLAAGGKAIVLGRLTPRVAELLGLELGGPLELPEAWGDCTCDEARHHDESPAAVRWCRTHLLATASPLAERPLCRFDFAREWNNLGFGRITTNGGLWSLQSRERWLGDVVGSRRHARW